MVCDILLLHLDLCLRVVVYLEELGSSTSNDDAPPRTNANRNTLLDEEIAGL